MASQSSLKFPKNKKAFSKKPELATITEDIPSSYRCGPAIPIRKFELGGLI